MTIDGIDVEALESATREFARLLVESAGTIAEAARDLGLGDFETAVRDFARTHEAMPINLLSCGMLAFLLSAFATDLQAVASASPEVAKLMARADEMFAPIDRAIDPNVN